jgi:sugar O-acyltransferase (sialic acid O-acetyltransferase NeuD family)
MNRDRTTPVVVLGAGGHGKVIVSALRALGRPVAALLDDVPERWGQTIQRVPITGPTSELASMQGVTAFLAIGDNRTRSQVARDFPDVEWATIVHPHAYVDPTAVLGPGTIVCAGAVVQPDAVIGSHVIVNTCASVDHDCRVGDYAHVACGVRLAGSVHVAVGALLGVGSVVIPGQSIGEWSVVGAGAVVTRTVPDHVTAVGVPARATGRSNP